VLAGELTTSAERNVQFIPAKKQVMGTMAQCQVTRWTSGTKRQSAKQARQNAIAGPRTSTGHPFNTVVCVKNPLVLHNTEASTTNHTPGTFARNNLGSRSALPDEFVLKIDDFYIPTWQVRLPKRMFVPKG
jgi:hypothetical protein